jgi:predicted nucleotide-binding protein
MKKSAAFPAFASMSFLPNVLAIRLYFTWCALILNLDIGRQLPSRELFKPPVDIGLSPGAHSSSQGIIETMGRMAKVVIIDDDMAMETLADGLIYRGYDAIRIKSASQAIKALDELAAADLIILDIIMSWPAGVRKRKLGGEHTAGMEILIQLRAKRKDLPVIVYSATQDESIISAIRAEPESAFLSKWNEHTVQDIADRIAKRLHLESSAPQSKVFIVHGQDDTTKFELKNYLQNSLGFAEPTILHEQPNRGRTIIEKFEDYAIASTLVFVLLTPDDRLADPLDSEELKYRARQNVVFEMGFFLAQLGRRSGRVILLHKGPIDLPSDISGIVYIDISHGIESAGELIRRELQNVK